MHEDASLIITEQNINILNLSSVEGRFSAVLGDGGGQMGENGWGNFLIMHSLRGKILSS